MGKVNGHPSGTKAVVRQPMIGDPAIYVPKQIQRCNPRRLRTKQVGDPPKQETYQDRLDQRKQQRSPARPHTPRKPGPHHRAAGTTRDQWIEIMSGKEPKGKGA